MKLKSRPFAHLCYLKWVLLLDSSGFATVGYGKLKTKLVNLICLPFVTVKLFGTHSVECTFLEHAMK